MLQVIKGAVKIGTAVSKNLLQISAKEISNISIGAANIFSQTVTSLQQKNFSSTISRIGNIIKTAINKADQVTEDNQQDKSYEEINVRIPTITPRISKK